MNRQTDVFAPDQMWLQVYRDLQYKGPANRHMKRIVKNLLAQIEYESVLDVGCGPAVNLPLLRQGRRLSSITGIDISAWAIEGARKSEEGEFHLLDIEQGRIDGRWDLVFCSLLLEHLPNDVAALRNMRMMTGRYLVVTTVAGNFERYRAWEERLGHVRNYKPGELEEKLALTGFRVRRSVYWGFPFYSPLARTLQNFSKVGIGEYSKSTCFIANILYCLYFLNSYQRGDLLVVLAEV